MNESAFDLPRATALLDQRIASLTLSANSRREMAESWESMGNKGMGAKQRRIAAIIDAETEEWRSIAARLASGERDRERLDWLDTGRNLENVHVCDEPIDGKFRFSSAQDPEYEGSYSFLLNIREAIDWAARSSEGSPTNG